MQLKLSISTALSARLTTAFIWLLACLLLFSAHIHIANMLGWNGRPWSEFPLPWRVMDILMLTFEVTVATGLIYRKLWAITGFIAGMILLQIIPFTFFQAYFAEKPSDRSLLNALVAVETALVLFLLVLITVQGTTHGSDNRK